MASSYPFGKREIRKYLVENFDSNSTILDVGCGQGTYYDLLSDYFDNIEGVEIYEPNIINYNLREKYKNVYNENIADCRYNHFDIIIFGDVIEHLSVEDAQKVLEYALPRCKEMVVALPYQYEQGEIDGNKYEIHIQDDLTPQIIKERYPYLKLLIGNEEYGYYVKGLNEWNTR